MGNFSGVDLHKTTKGILILGQFFGLIPVSGVLSGNLTYNCHSLKASYSCIFLVAHFMMATAALSEILFNNLTFRACNIIMIYVPGFLMYRELAKLGKYWPELMEHFCSVQDIFAADFYQQDRKETKLKRCITGTHLTSLLILAITVGEYSFSLACVYEVTSTEEKTQNIDIWKALTIKLFCFVTDHVQYTPALGIFLLTMNFCCMFIWNFMDLFIIIMCNALVKKFDVIAAKITQSSHDDLESTFYWQKIREDYNQIAQLFHYLDEKISGIVLLSFAANVYYILVQLFLSLSLSSSHIEKSYFIVSFGMLLLRTTAVSMVAAKLNDASRAPLAFLTMQPSEFYNEDLERLVMEISQDNIALSGFMCFRITRGFLFRIAGTIVTYELFLFQFQMSLSAAKEKFPSHATTYRNTQ